jgi:hypothetical protein
VNAVAPAWVWDGSVKPGKSPYVTTRSAEENGSPALEASNRRCDGRNRQADIGRSLPVVLSGCQQVIKKGWADFWLGTFAQKIV